MIRMSSCLQNCEYGFTGFSPKDHKSITAYIFGLYVCLMRKNIFQAGSIPLENLRNPVTFDASCYVPKL